MSSGDTYVTEDSSELVEVTTEDTAASNEAGYATRSRSKINDDIKSNSSDLSDKTDSQVGAKVGPDDTAV